MTTPLTQRDLHTLLATCSPRDALMMRLMASTGLRVKEVVSLNVGDVRHHVDGTVRLSTFKGSGNEHYRARQDVAIDDTKGLLTDLLTYTADHPDAAPLFANANNERMSTNGVRWILKTTSKRAGIRHVHPHALRHTFATALVEADVHPSVVQACMRHASYSTTARYIHPTTASKQAAAMAVGV